MQNYLQISSVSGQKQCLLSSNCIAAAKSPASASRAVQRLYIHPGMSNIDISFQPRKSPNVLELGFHAGWVKNSLA